MFLSTVASGGGSATDREAHTILYPNDSTQDQYLYDDGYVKVALENAMDTLVAENAISGYTIARVRMDHDWEYPDCSDGSKDTFAGEFESWLMNSSPYYSDYVGIHFGVAGGFDDAGGSNNSFYDFDPDGSSTTAFDEAHVFYLGTDTFNYDRIRNFSIQEPMHGFISYHVAVNQGLVDSGSHTHEHDTGKINLSKEVTPMATTWTSATNKTNHAKHGQCSTTLDHDSGQYHPEITDCTIDAVKYTADAANQ